MRMKREMLGAVVWVLVTLSVAAQEKPGTLAALEFQTPKNGMVKQYEEGRKQKAEWHKQQKDNQPLQVWEIISGDSNGTYIVGRTGQHWADFDKPVVPDQADLDEYNKVVGAYVESVIPRYYDYLPKMSTATGSGTPSKYSEIVIYHTRWGHGADFRTAIKRVFDAAQKTKWGVEFGWYSLANGGREGEYVLVIPHKNWADFEDKPDQKPFRDMLKEAFGQSEADSIVKLVDTSVEGATTEILEYRADLSYVPGK
jgi:hypothetical protein